MRLHKDLGFVVSRIQHNGETTLATADSRLVLDDIVAVVGHQAALERAHHLFGGPAKVQIERDRNVLDYRRVFVSSRDCVGKRIGDLNLPQQLSATITRLRRGDLDFVPNPATRLEFGDRIRVLTSPANFAAVSQFFGDSIRGTAEINFGSVGLGMTLGVILGLIPIPLPSGTALRLGLAGGPLVVGLILGHREHTGPFTGVIPLSANLALRQIGLVLFQAGVGTRAGFGFVETVHTSGVEMILAGGLITAGVALASLFVGHRLLKRPFESVLGLTCAIHTKPASLAFASHISRSGAPKLRTRKFSRCARWPRLSLRKLLVAWR